MDELKAKLYQQIDFGDPDGLYDKNLLEYFVDTANYWKEITNGKIFYVVGRKGTGKSAIYKWIKLKEKDTGIIVSNLSFKDFPYERLLHLTDDDFHHPNQYQSIWKLIILAEIARLIIIDPKSSCVNEAYSELSTFVERTFGSDLQDLYAQVTTKVTKCDGSLKIYGSGIGSGSECKTEYGCGYQNITMIIRRLEILIENYLISLDTSRYIIQFDQLDDNYTSFLNNEMDYFQSIVSLFKVIYELNQKYSEKELPVKIVGYLRSDIFDRIHNYDAESSRWLGHTLKINWISGKISRNNNQMLLDMINTRIKRSCPNLSELESPLVYLFDGISMLSNRYGSIPVHKYIIHRTFQRPRDMVQFCIMVQNEVNKTGIISEEEILNAEKEYSSWLINELVNEMGPVIKDKSYLLHLLRNFESKTFDQQQFSVQYHQIMDNVGKNTDEILKYLYELGVLLNVDDSDPNQRKIYSSYVNEHSKYNNRLKIKIHPGLRVGLYNY